MEHPTIKIDNLSVSYFNNDDYALDNINLEANDGEFICILGKSGSGKSTLIRCLNGLIQPTKGAVCYKGKNLLWLKDEQLRKVRREMGMIFQQFNLIPRLTVSQNVLTGMFGYRSKWKNFLGVFSEEEKQQMENALKLVELESFKNKRVEKLSGGQKQRVGIARALVQRPEVFLGDEPVASLDPGISEKIFQLIKRVHDEHKLLTIINVHDVTLAKRFATRIIALKDGKVIFDDKPHLLTNEVIGELYDMQDTKIESQDLNIIQNAKD
ncbi:phosphonate ABC transporter ATP-binding protein [Lottiidibacillus patelloidae]|uniref:Phosphonate ABC transporter ATP-binding protein n=1 Tax=Lottiidibacillus patelloidae TaxID=2670334 RepID=A0A263BRV8_9BACI|nr:phosphonate ABC transporter ATP-binding protein [Lottiidibacillus patelloidae]OZM56312.1 phosphonate ABC transporter ATP-binding protein [Lottiidibacillus patelloidae]